MRILYDARSVRTAAGAYVFRGLTTGWLSDSRVNTVLAGVTSDSDRATMPPGVEPLEISSNGWLHHLSVSLPRIADRARADIIFVPNGLPPRDRRSVIYFQDLFHFYRFAKPGLPASQHALNIARSLWRARATSECKLAVPVSSDIEREVAKRLSIPIVMIPNGVDVGNARWTGEGRSVVVMGGRGDRKGEDLAIRAWTSISSSSRRGLGLRVIGVEPPERRKTLIDLARSAGVEDSVAIEGGISRDAFLEHVASSVLAVSCSNLEAFGLPVAEALAMGAPVLASDIPSHRELIERAGAGGTFPTGDSVQLARRLESALNGCMPAHLTAPPAGWSWQDRAREHIDAYLGLSNTVR